MSYLVLVRHGMSEYNEKGVWTGWDDPPLSKKGVDEAKKAGESLTDISFDVAFTSPLKRAKQTLSEIKTVLNIHQIPTIEDTALNERNYGIYTGKNKWEVQKQLGEEEFKKLRRSWDYPIPNGESLKQVYERIIPYYKSTILPYLTSGKNVLVSSSGNTLRALVKYLENIQDNAIATLEIPTGEAYVYQINNQGSIPHKEIRSSKSK